MGKRVIVPIEYKVKTFVEVFVDGGYNIDEILEKDGVNMINKTPAIFKEIDVNSIKILKEE